MPAEARNGLTSLVASLGLRDPNKLPLRKDGCPAHPHLVKKRGWACKGCTERTTSRDLMQRHLSKIHGCRTDRESQISASIRNYVTLQSWTQNGPRESLIVEDGIDIALSDNSNDPVPQVSPRRLRKVASLHEEERRRLAERDQDESTTNATTDELALTTNWMRRTGWAKTFANADRHLLSLLDQMPARDGHSLELGYYGERVVYSSVEDERRLAMVGQAADRFFDRCEDTARNTDHSIRCWLRSQIPGRSYKTPFELPGREDTRVSYRNLSKRMLFVLLRLHRLEGAMRDEFLDVRLSRKLQKAIECLWVLTQEEEFEHDIIAPGFTNWASALDRSRRNSGAPVSRPGQPRRSIVNRRKVHQMTSSRTLSGSFQPFFAWRKFPTAEPAPPSLFTSVA